MIVEIRQWCLGREKIAFGYRMVDDFLFISRNGFGSLKNDTVEGVRTRPGLFSKQNRSLLPDNRRGIDIEKSGFISINKQNTSVVANSSDHDRQSVDDLSQTFARIAQRELSRAFAVFQFT